MQRPEKSDGLRTMTLSWEMFRQKEPNAKASRQVKECVTCLRNSQRPMWRD